MKRITAKLTTFAAIVLTLAACASTVKPLPAIPGVTATSVVLYLHEGNSATLDGHVERGIDKLLIERYVRDNYNVSSLVNLISVR